VAEDQRPKQTAIEREGRRLEKIRKLRLVEAPREKVPAPAEIDYGPEEAA
jgi:hypothetical protein